MTVSIAICAHVARARQAYALAVDMAAPVAMDDGSYGSNANHDRAFQLAYDIAADVGSEWCLVLEDDAIPVAPDRIGECLANCPTDAASLYLGTSYPRWEQPSITKRMGFDWIIADIFLHGVAMAVRTHRVPTMLADAQAITVDADRRYGFALQRQGVRVSHTTRSLFDHRDDPTLIDHDDNTVRKLPRVARMRADDATLWRRDSRAAI